MDKNSIWQQNHDEEDECRLPFGTIVILPDGVTDIQLRQYEQQENPFSNIKQKMRWLCEIADTCPLDGTADRQTTGYGDTQAEAYNNAVENWRSN